MDSKKCQKRRRREYDSSLKTFNNQNSNKFVTQMMQNVQFWEGKKVELENIIMPHAAVVCLF